MPNWEAFRFTLALARSGGLAGAAKSLGMSYSTAHRHLETIERDFGVAIFKRVRAGYELTNQGKILAEAAQRMEDEVLAVRREIAGNDSEISGVIRVSTSELLGFYALPQLVYDFQKLYPDIRIELSVQDALVDLQRFEADVAIRGSSNPLGTLIGRSLGNIPYAVYVHRRLFDQLGETDLPEYRWIILDNGSPNNFLSRWTYQLVQEPETAVRVDSGACLCVLLEGGHGAATVPCFVGDSMPSLVRLTEPMIDPALQLWVLNHADLRNNARILAFKRFIKQQLPALTQCIPESPPAGPEI